MVSRQAFEVLKTRGLALRVYTALLLRGQPGDKVRASYREIASLIGSSKSAVIKGCGQLVELGLIQDTLAGDKSTKVWLISDEEGCRESTSLDRGCRKDTLRGVEIGTVVRPTSNNNSIDTRSTKTPGVKWTPPKWASEDLVSAVCFALDQVPHALKDKRSQGQDRHVWQALRRYEKEGDEARCAKLRDASFWGEILRSANWPAPPPGIGKAGYGKRISMELDKSLESVQGSDKLRSAAEEHLAKLRDSFSA